jgi:16S rRNA (adenine1518-N6/adenine1519-N6)-dimethyltransferase
LDAYLSPTAIQQVLKAYGLKALRSLGQHFLVDRNLLEKTVAFAGLTPADKLVEIGPGLGNLTGFLLPHVDRLLALEIDKGFVPILRERFAGQSHFDLWHTDAAKADLSDILTRLGATAYGYKVVANIPYQITSLLLGKFLETETPPERLVLMVQRDVADRLLAVPPAMNPLAVLAQSVAAVRLLSRVGAAQFWPAPEVDSAIVGIYPDPAKYAHLGDIAAFRAFVHAGFAARRKQLAPLLAKAYDLPADAVRSQLADLGRPPTARAESLTAADWRALFAALKRPAA